MKYLLLLLLLTGCSVKVDSPFLQRSGLTEEEKTSLESILTKQQKQLDAIGKAVIELQEKDGS